MLKITCGRGYQIIFDNGWTVSVQWGVFNYCSNKSYDSVQNLIGADKEAGEKGAETVELAAWKDIDDTWLKFGNDTVAPYVNAESVADVMYFLSRDLPKDAVNAVNKEPRKIKFTGLYPTLIMATAVILFAASIAFVVYAP